MIGIDTGNAFTPGPVLDLGMKTLTFIFHLRRQTWETTALQIKHIIGAQSNDVLHFQRQCTVHVQIFKDNESIVQYIYIHSYVHYVLSGILLLKQVCMNVAVARITTGSADDNTL